MDHYLNHSLDDIKEETNDGIAYEEWKDIKGYNGYYRISNFGRIKRMKGYRARVDRIVKSCENHGYRQVVLCSNCITKHFYVHVIVGTHFIPNPKNYPELNHIKGIRHDNRSTQLEWCTRSQNIRHQLYVLGDGMPLGEKAYAAKLNNESVLKIRELGKNTKTTIADLGRQFNITRRQVRNVLNRVHWKHI